MDQQIGRYQILEEIAWGGQGAVYRVFDPDTGRIVALKVLHRFPSNDTTYVERFRREASLASSIDHPNVVKIFDVGSDGDQHFMALEFLPESLGRVIEGGGPMRLDRATVFGVQIADGLAEAHALGIVHRDIKPENILLGPDGVAKVTDFGIARADVLSPVTATVEVVGTPHYMSPEQSRGEETDARSDIYSLGCMLYQMLTGELPFKGNTPLAIIRQQIEDEPTPMRDLREDLTPALESLVERAMAKDRENRFQSVSDLSAALRAALPEIGSVSRTLVGPRVEDAIALPSTLLQPVGSLTRAESWTGVWLRVRRSRWGQAGVALSFMLTLAVGTVQLGLWEEVSGFIGSSGPATLPAGRPPVSPDAPAAVPANAAPALTASLPASGVTPVQSTAPPNGPGSASLPADQAVSSVPVMMVIAASAPTRLVSSQGEVTVDIAAGAVPDDVTLTYRPVTPEQTPALPQGFTVSDRVFDLSVTGAQASEPDEFMFDSPIMVTVSLSVRDVVLAGGASGNIVIQHFHDDQWELLPTSVDFGQMVAWAEVYALSIFALTIKEPEPQPVVAAPPSPTATAAPTPTATPRQIASRTSTATPVPPGLVVSSSVTPTPTVTPTSTIAPTPTITPMPTPTLTPTSTAAATSMPSPTPAGPSITALASTARSGDPVTAEFSGAPGNETDWIGLYRVGESNETPAAFQYLEGATEGSVTLIAFVVAGMYEWRMFADWPEGGYVDIATSGNIEVITAPAATPTFTPAPTLTPTPTVKPVPTPTPGRAQDTGGGPVSIGVTETAAIDFPGDTDDWTFFALSGNAVTVSLRRVEDSNLDPLLKLIAPSGLSEATDDDSGAGIDALISGWILQETGTYTIRTESVFLSRQGAYRLDVALFAPPTPTPTPTATATPSATGIATSTGTPTPTPTTTAALTPTPNLTITPTPTMTSTATPTPTPTATATVTPTATPSPTQTPTPADTTAPAAPTGLASSSGDGWVSLDWASNTETDLVSYTVKRATVSAGPYTQIASAVAVSAYADTSVTNETTYYYVVTAVDSAANESSHSNETSATPVAPLIEQLLEQNISGGNKTKVKEGQKGAQAFSHGAVSGPGYRITRIVVHLSRDKVKPNGDLTLSIGTGVNSGTLPGSVVNITSKGVTDSSAGTSFMSYEVVYGTPVGPLDAGTTYYLNFENEAPNGRAFYLEHALGNTYANGTYYKGGSDDGKDSWFQIWGG